MRGRFNSYCCCYCDSCCNDLAPDEYEVTVYFGADPGGCARCDDSLTGTFVLSRVGQSCVWGYKEFFNVGPLSDRDCENEVPDVYSPPDWQLYSLEMALSIACSSATEYTITLTLKMTFLVYNVVPGVDEPANCAAYGGSSTLWFTNDYGYTATVNSGTFNCQTVSGQVLSRAPEYQSCFCWVSGAGSLGYPFGDYCDPDRYACSGPAYSVNAWLSAVVP